jgi:parallel beta-helix repeat protein
MAQATPATSARPHMSTPLLQGDTIVVNSTSDSGPGSLREAIGSALPGDSITFDSSVFPPTNPDTISLVSELPALLQGNLVIDASEAGVVIDGSRITTPELVFGLSISSNNNIIRGLQIVNFTQAGIGLDGAQNNIIGGDRDIGEGPLGQGNLVSGDGTFGIGLWSNGTSFNTIQGNFIGTDVSGTKAHGSFSGGIFSGGADYNLFVDNLIGGYEDHGVRLSNVSDGYNTVRGNYIGTDTSGLTDIGIDNTGASGIVITGSGFNVIGPANVIALNDGSGIVIKGKESVGNTITQNIVHDNDKLGIDLWYGGNTELAAPVLFDFDKQAGMVTGMACANCTVEVFSDNTDEGAVYEGQTTADNAGTFTFNKGATLMGPNVTATATDTKGNTSKFSVPTPDTPTRTLILQEGNNLPKTRLQPKRSEELADNRIGGGWEVRWILDLGVKHTIFSNSEAEWPEVQWSIPEFEVSPWLDGYVTTLAANGVTLINQLCFWDKANHPEGWEEVEGYSRFQTEEEIERYLEYVQFNVNHFKDRVQYFELWNEPDNQGFPIQYIQVPDYINLVKRVVPVIRQEYPEAKIVVGSVSNLMYTKDYLFGILKSEEIMPLVDVICWHPFFGASPAYDDTREYYYQYPSIVQAIKDTASTHGFSKENYVAEMGWSSYEFSGPDQWVHSEIQSAKYYARGVVMHLGMNVNAQVGGLYPDRVTPFATVRNLCTVMAGTRSDSVSIEIQSAATNIRTYGFSLPGGDKMIALWTDSVAIDDDPGITATLILPEFSDQSMMGIDVINSFLQKLITEVENGKLVIRNLMVKDYPIIVSSASAVDIATDRSPFTFALLQNYPNPFNTQTTITYELKENAQVSLKIYNIFGQLAETVVNDYKTAGYHSVLWNASNVSSGLYFYRIEVGEYTETKKCLILK